MKLTKLFLEFFNSEKAGGLLLILITIISIVLANSGFGETYINFWATKTNGHSLLHWINDGLMAIFFLLIGLELEREVYIGELSDLKNATLPIIGALGGMIVPALLFISLNFGTEYQAGAGIPMATDIAFAIGIMSLLGKRVPVALKVFLTALAVIDDLGAIIIIAVFYSATLNFTSLFISIGIFVFLVFLNRLKVRNLLPYLAGGIAMWYFMLDSGIHATITGVLLAFAVPFGDGGEKSTSYVLQHFLHKPVALFILPLFAMANTAIPIFNLDPATIIQSHTIGIFIGLFIGKPLGIILFTLIGTALGLCALSPGMKWKNILGAGFLAGIGFTMSIFITLIAFQNQDIVNSSKISILIASLLSGIAGFLFLRYTLGKNAVANEV